MRECVCSWEVQKKVNMYASVSGITKLRGRLDPRPQRTRKVAPPHFPSEDFCISPVSVCSFNNSRGFVNALFAVAKDRDLTRAARPTQGHTLPKTL